MRKRSKYSILLSAVCLTVFLALSHSPAQGAALYVNESQCVGQGTGTAEAPYCTIQEAINGAENGDEILVYDGTYFDNLDLQGKNLIIRYYSL